MPAKPDMTHSQANIWGLSGRPSLVIFDLDGTLVDSLEDLAASINFMRHQFSLQPLSTESVRQCIGKGARNLVARTLPEQSEEIDRALSLFLEHNGNNIAVHSRLYPGAMPLLTALKQAGIPLVVVSNKDTALSRHLLTTLKIADYFHEILGGDALPHCKPSPEPLLEAISRTGACADTTVMIGDSSNDFDAARAAGVRSIACTFGFGEPWEMERANLRICSFAELLPLPF